MKNMRNTLLLVSAFALAACGGALNNPEELQAAELGLTEAPLIQAMPGKRIPGQYIVMLKDGAMDSRSLVANKGLKAKYTYTVIPGFAAALTDDEVSMLRKDPNVAYIEEDGIVTVEATQTGATWGLDRIDQRALPLNWTYGYTTTASNVTAYIIDSGLQANHPEFTGRAVNVYDAFGGNGADCNGHGTHVGGTVGGITYGVAKGVKLRGVRVVSCYGTGTDSTIIAGMDWVRYNAVRPAVANISLGGTFSSALNTAANNLANSGVFVAVAAGNQSRDACNYSPASASAVTTVGSSTSTDGRSWFSNFGSCVDIFAPGSDITSANLNGAAITMSGTSMASPHVAGVGALYKGTYGDAPSATVDSWIKNNATLLGGGRLLYNGYGGLPPPPPPPPSSGTWTQWLDRDEPSGVGDYEDLVNFPNVCNGITPIGIECTTLSGVDWRQTGQVYECSPSLGGVCVNSWQTDGRECLDYAVRFLCP